jgi:hypothetical protein
LALNGQSRKRDQMNKIRKICWIIANFIIFKWAADYLIATIQMMIENHWGLSAVPLLLMVVFAEWKVIENIFTEINK